METTKKETELVAKTKRTDLMMVSPYNIVIEDEFNSRKDYGNIEELMLSIVNTGQQEPVSGYKMRGEEKYVLTDGHRRMKAILMAIEKGYDIPYVKFHLTSANIEDRLFAQVITGVGKKPLTPVEEAEVYKRLNEMGYEPKEISIKVGKSLMNIYNSLKLADAPKIIKNRIQSDEISATTVVQLMRQVKDSSKVVDEVEKAILSKLGSNKKGKVKVSDLNVNKLKTPLQKLAEAIEQIDNNVKNKEVLNTLYSALSDKKTTTNDIVEILKQL